MATFRNDTGDDLTIDRFGLYVPAGLTFEIPDEDADSLAGQPALVRVATDPDVLIPDEIVRDITPDVVDEPADATPAPVDVAPTTPDVAPAAPAATEPAPSAPAVVDEPAAPAAEDSTSSSDSSDIQL